MVRCDRRERTRSPMALLRGVLGPARRSARRFVSEARAMTLPSLRPPRTSRTLGSDRSWTARPGRVPARAVIETDDAEATADARVADQGATRVRSCGRQTGGKTAATLPLRPLCGHRSHRTPANARERHPAKPSVLGGFRPCSLAFADLRNIGANGSDRLC